MYWADLFQYYLSGILLLMDIFPRNTLDFLVRIFKITLQIKEELKVDAIYIWDKW